jgi:hypothetical protein
MVRQGSAERAVIELFVATDRRDWPRVRRLLADRVDVDMSSLGGSTGLVEAEALVAAWEAGLAPLEAVHHQVGNLRSTIHEDDAHVACHGVAFHYLRNAAGRNTRIFVGTYDVGLRDSPRGWHIHTFRFNLRFQDGNLALT